MKQPIDRGAIARMLMQLFEHWQLETGEQLNFLGLCTDNRAALTRYRRGKSLSKSGACWIAQATCSESTKNLRLLFPHDRNLTYA